MACDQSYPAVCLHQNHPKLMGVWERGRQSVEISHAEGGWQTEGSGSTDRPQDWREIAACTPDLSNCFSPLQIPRTNQSDDTGDEVETHTLPYGIEGGHKTQLWCGWRMWGEHSPAAASGRQEPGQRMGPWGQRMARIWGGGSIGFVNFFSLLLL